MKKKLLPVLLCASMLALTACSSGTQTNTDSSETAESAAAEASETAETLIETGDDDSDKAVILPDDYLDYTVTSVLDSVTEDDAISYINENLVQGISKDAACAEGDVVAADYTVVWGDGEDEQGSSSTTFTVGSGEVMDEFEDNIIGLSKDESTTFQFTYPEDYTDNAQLAGLETTVTVTVTDVMDPVTFDEITDDQLAAINEEYGTKEELKEAVIELLAEQAEENYSESVQSEISSYIEENSHIAIMDETAFEAYKETYEKCLDTVCQAQMEMSYKEYLAEVSSLTDLEYERQLDDDAYDAYSGLLIAKQICDENHLSVTEDDINEVAEEYYENYGFESADEFIEAFGDDVCSMYAAQEISIEYLVRVLS